MRIPLSVQVGLSAMILFAAPGMSAEDLPRAVTGEVMRPQLELPVCMITAVEAAEGSIEISLEISVSPSTNAFSVTRISVEREASVSPEVWKHVVERYRGQIGKTVSMRFWMNGYQVRSGRLFVSFPSHRVEVTPSDLKVEKPQGQIP